MLRPLTDTYNAAIGVCLDRWQQALVPTREDCQTRSVVQKKWEANGMSNFVGKFLQSRIYIYIDGEREREREIYIYIYLQYISIHM